MTFTIAPRVRPGGQALTLYLGHSNAQGFWAGRARYLDRDDWHNWPSRGPGLFATFGCLGCQLTGKDGEGYGVAAMRTARAGRGDRLARHLLRGHRPPGRRGLFDQMLTGRRRNGWPGLHKVQEGVARGPINAVTFRLLDAVDGDSDIPEATQRREHLEMFLLLGDPALKLPILAADVKLKTNGDVTAGKMLTITGEAPARLEGAKVRLTLERPLGSSPPDLQPLPKEGDERAKVMLANHERANRFVLLTREATVKDGRFEVRCPCRRRCRGRG